MGSKKTKILYRHLGAIVIAGICAPLSACALGHKATAVDVPTNDEYEIWSPILTPAGSDLCTKEDQPATIVTIDPAQAIAELSFESILGEPIVADAAILASFVQRNNPNFPIEIAEAYLRIGRVYGIRGDVAMCQAIIETGWFKFADGTAVKPEQYNFCGLGVTGRGATGSSFGSIDDGVTAQIQHLYAYCCTKPIPQGETLLDPRFSLVSRGIAPTWHDLSNRWAMNKNYGRQIVSLYRSLLDHASQ